MIKLFTETEYQELAAIVCREYPKHETFLKVMSYEIFNRELNLFKYSFPLNFRIIKKQFTRTKTKHFKNATVVLEKSLASKVIRIYPNDTWLEEYHNEANNNSFIQIKKTLDALSINVNVNSTST